MVMEKLVLDALGPELKWQILRFHLLVNLLFISLDNEKIPLIPYPL